MPQIPKGVLDTTFYLYRTEQDALTGRDMGGSGFLVIYDVSPWPTKKSHVYAVSNWHVAVKGGASVIRLNRRDGTTETFPFDPSDWTFAADGDDIAAVRVPIDFTIHQAGAIDLSRFVLNDQVRHGGHITTGEDVFMVGRFMDHDGGEINLPAVRFGNISLLPTSIALHEIGRPREYYCIDMHSRTGFSGSPVFVYRTIGSDLTGDDIRRLMEGYEQSRVARSPWDPRPYLGLLGIHCGQFPENLLIERLQFESHRGPLKEYVIGLSGMTIVAPAWGILDVLEHQDLRNERARIDASRSMSDFG